MKCSLKEIVKYTSTFTHLKSKLMEKYESLKIKISKMTSSVIWNLFDEF